MAKSIPQLSAAEVEQRLLTLAEEKWSATAPDVVSFVPAQQAMARLIEIGVIGYAVQLETE